VFTRPAAGRAFFEGLIRDHLDPGRPDQVSLVFGRPVRLAGPRPAPGTFRTKVITDGAGPQIVCYYKSSRLKQYFKQHRALRTETVICDTRDFGVGRRLTYENWNTLRDVGEHASQRLCDAEAAGALPAPDVATHNQVTRPSATSEGQHAPALRSGDDRVMALMAAITGFCHLITGFDNRTLAQRMRALPSEDYTSRQATHHLRRLRRKQIIERIPGSHRYQLTPSGRAVAVLFTKAYDRIPGPGPAALDPQLPSDQARRSPLALAWKDLSKELDRFITHGLAAA
jgi:DNA-binding HxlR family transcriptional regulator